ncbi:probable E3 ubiquitin-protein ligase TRIML2 [Molossus molossus]|uniref:probable E3 ubiquitin-protein ligase TRIML2 n=1 Tax=Molossus molossus TaxID=27622 RepID=UPI0017462BA9|nr:probable E3 ubiquitin-protein ligase TRIML2 [Molossus molossus]
MSGPEHRHCSHSGHGSASRWKQPGLFLGLPTEMYKSLSPPSPYIPDDFYCWKHLEPRVLFCEDEQVTLCNKCYLTQEHRSHAVFGAQEAAELYRKLFQDLLSTLKGKLEVAEGLLAEEQERMLVVQVCDVILVDLDSEIAFVFCILSSCFFSHTLYFLVFILELEMEKIYGHPVVFNLKSIISMSVMKREEHNFKEIIKSECKMMFRLMTEENKINFQNLQGCLLDPALKEASLNQMMAFAADLEEKYQKTLQKLSSLGRENITKLQESEIRLYEQICSLQRTIIELEKKCGESPLALLKDVRYCLERSGGSLLLQCVEPAQITTPRLCQIPGMSEMLELIQRPITLDPKTAHPSLVLSEDLRSVTFKKVQQDVPGHPGVFNFGASVLGAESFTSGRHYWEVDVQKATKWLLGVYEDPTSRLDVMPKGSGDKILVMGSVMGTDCAFWAFPPLKRVSLGEQMHRVGVYLDYKYGQISFYDVTKKLLIYNFSHLVFQGAVRPIFSLCFPNGGTNSDTLSICVPDVFFL